MPPSEPSARLHLLRPQRRSRARPAPAKRSKGTRLRRLARHPAHRRRPSLEHGDRGSNQHPPGHDRAVESGLLRIGDLPRRTASRPRPRQPRHSCAGRQGRRPALIPLRPAISRLHRRRQLRRASRRTPGRHPRRRHRHPSRHLPQNPRHLPHRSAARRQLPGAA